MEPVLPPQPERAPEPREETRPESRKGLWAALVLVAGLAVLVLVGKFGGFFEPEQLGAALGLAIRDFADGPYGVPALVLAFCAGAFLAVPQFVLIGVAVFAFGPGLGAVYAWVATMTSGSLSYGIGRVSGHSVLSRISSRRLDRFTRFVGRNAFVASAVVRNIPAGPFLFVNMVFGALKAGFAAYFAGMALGSVPKIALVAFAGKGIRAAVEGNPVLAVLMGLAAIAVFAGGWLYVRYRRGKGDNIALRAKKTVDSA